MTRRSTTFVVALTMAIFIQGCGSSSEQAPTAVEPTTGTISISITDGPWEDAMAMVLHITGVEMGHADGSVTTHTLNGGGMSVDMVQLQNGASHVLAGRIEVPTGQYFWMRLVVDPAQSHMDSARTGGRHGMRMGGNAEQGLEVHHAFEVRTAAHQEFMLDFDIRRGVQHHDNGMMGGEYRLHSAMRMVNLSESGGLMGEVHPSLIDVNHADCDNEVGGNWAYLFHGNTTEPDDITDVDTDGRIGPIAADRIELDTMTGEHRYHFGYLEPGRYRIGVTCSSEWDEVGDDDYPMDPEGRFAFQMFSDAIEVMPRQMHDHDLSP